MINKIIKFLFLIVLLCVCSYSVLAYNDKISSDNPRLYKQGIEFFNASDYQNAYYNFSKVNKFSPLYKIAILRQAQCADKLNNYNIAEEKYKSFIKLSPKSVFLNSAQYNLAKVLFSQKKYIEAKLEFLKLSDLPFDNEYGIGSKYFLGLIEKSYDKTKAKEYFLDYIEMYTTGKNSLNCAQELSAYDDELSVKENFLVGRVYFDNKKFDKALKYFYHVPVEKSWAYLAISNMNLKNKSSAKKMIEEGIQKYSGNVDREILLRAYTLYAESVAKTKTAGWELLFNLVTGSKAEGRDFVLYKYAQVLPAPKSLNLFSQIIKEYPKSEFAPEACWQEYWNFYQNGEYKKAQQTGNLFLKNYQKSSVMPKMLYWLGKLAQKQGDKQLANNYFSKIMNLYSDNYYAFRTYAHTHSIKNAWIVDENKYIPEKQYEIDFPLSYSNIDIKDIKLINTLLELGDTEVWVEADFGNKVVESWFALKRGHIQRSMVLARDAIDKMPVKPHFDDVVYLLAYPKHYVSEINKYAKKDNLSPFLVMSLMREESYFNPNIKSSAGALGLMQLMPSTADFVSKKFNLQISSTEQSIIEPKNNIALGCGYLKFLDEHFNGNDLLSVIAYNAGNGSVRKWLDNAKYIEFDEFIESIPYNESRDYIKKVYRSYWNYINIYK